MKKMKKKEKKKEKKKQGSRKARLFGASILAEGARLARLNCASLKALRLTSGEALELGVASPCAQPNISLNNFLCLLNIS